MLSPADYLIIAGGALLASFTTSLLGFGAGMVMTPVVGLSMPIKAAVGAVAFLSLFSSGSKSWLFRQHVEWRRLAWIALPALPGLALGVWILDVAPAGVIRFVFGALLTAYAVKTLLAPSLKKKGEEGEAQYSEAPPEAVGDMGESVKPSPFEVLLAFVAAVAGALLHAAGPFLAVIFRRHGAGRMSVVGSIAVLHFIFNVVKVPLYVAWGLVSPDVFPHLLPMVVFIWLGTLLGRHVLASRVSEALYGRLLGAALLLVGGRLLWP